MLLLFAMTERRSLALVATAVTLGRLVGGGVGAVAVSAATALSVTAATPAYEAAVAAVESAAASASVGRTGTAAAGRPAAAAGAGLVRERLFLLSNHSSRLLLFLSLLFAFAGRFFPCLREDAAVGGFLQEKEILSLLVSNTILAQLLCSKHSR
jgi:hypothetical protein